MTLLDLLAQDLLHWMAAAPDGAPRRVLLWLDPERQFERLVEHLEPLLVARGARLLRYAPEAGSGQVALKLALLRIEADGSCSVVVYLPGFGRAALEPRADGVPALWSVYDYRYKGCVWGIGGPGEVGTVPEPPTLLAWLQGHGVQVADESTRRELAQGGRDALLARFAERQRAVPLATWLRPLRRNDVEAVLGGDPRDALRRLLAAPTNEARSWGQERSVVLGRVAAEFGLSVPDPGAEPEVLASEFAVSLALVEAWDAFGRPADFPFEARLPARLEQRQRQVTFVREDVLSHTNLGPLFRQRAARLESSVDLSGWARGRPGQPGALPLLARARWQAFLERLNEAGAQGWKAARDLLATERDAIHAAADAPWAHLDREASWPTVRDLADLIAQAEAALAEQASLSSAAALVSAYAERWWQVDRLHLRVRASATAPGLETVRKVADAAYFEYVDRLADRLCGLVEAEPAWPPRGMIGVEGLRGPLWRAGGGRRAVIVADACRWDLAMALRDLLASGDCSVTPVLATLPTNTPFGMAALLPLDGGNVTVDFTTGRPAITADTGANLATRDGRKAFLQGALREASGKPRVSFVDLAALLQGSAVPSAPLIVVFDNDVDEQGHKGTDQLPRLADEFVAHWKRAIDRLHEAGVETVHLVTDHGFLLLPPDRVESLGTPEVPPAQALYKHVRWAALKPDAPGTEVMKLPLPSAPGAALLGIPRGVRSLMKPEPYLHGGISLQECVVPHLVSCRVLARERVGLELTVTRPELSGGTVPVVLRPSLKAGQTPLGGFEPITVQLWVETVPPPGGAALVVAGPYEQEVAADAKELKPPLFLAEGKGLKAGQALRLRAVDRASGRELATRHLRLLVDWD